MRWSQIQAQADVDSPAGDGDRILVLHVDDDPQHGDLVATYLEQIDENITVDTETDPQSGLERLQTESVDCVVSDFQMPEMNGIEFLKHVREEYPNLPFILFTGKGSEEIASEAINAGVTSYLQKSGTDTYELLANRVRNAVGHHRSKRLARVTEDRLFGLYEQADGFYVLDEEWTITYWNQRIAQRTGRSAEEVLGESYWEVFPEAIEQAFYNEYREVMATQEPSHFEEYFPPLETWFSVSAYPSEDGLSVYFRDVTERRRREQRLHDRIDQQRAVAEFGQRSLHLDDPDELFETAGRELHRWDDRVMELYEETGSVGATVDRAGEELLDIAPPYAPVMESFYARLVTLGYLKYHGIE